MGTESQCITFFLSAQLLELVGFVILEGGCLKTGSLF